MRSGLLRWLCGLSLGLALTGCGLFGGEGSPGDPARDRTPPEVPSFVEGTPKRANANTVSLRVQTEPGAHVEFFSDRNSYVYCTGEPAQVVTADEAGVAQAQFEVGDNTTTAFRVRARDAAGNSSGCTEPFVYTEDSLAPVAPRWLSSLATRSNANSVTLTVEAAANSRLALFGGSDCGGTALETVMAGDRDGQVSFTPRTVADDTTSVFSVSAADDLGNASCSAPFTFVEDSTPPAPPTLRDSAPRSPGATNSPDFIGDTEPGTTVLLYGNAQCSGTASKSGVANAQGRFQLELIVEVNTEVTVYARARDAVGNLSGCSTSSVTFVSDYTEPAEPIFHRFLPDPPSNDNTPELMGTSEPGTKVWIYSGDSCQGMPVSSALTDAQGVFRAPLFVVDDVTLSFSARAEDAAGNRGWCHRSSLKYTEDSTPPAAPSNVQLPPSPANNNTFTLSFSAFQFATGLLFTTPDCQGSPDVVQPASAGVVTVRLPVPDDSTTRVWLAVREPAGNTSACAGPFTYVEDSTPPSSAGATVMDGPGADMSHQFTGDSAEANWAGFSDAQGAGTYEHFLSVRADCSGGAVSTVSMSQAARVRVDGLALSEGTYFHCVRMVDAAGNATAWVGSNGFRVDLAIPTVVAVTPQANASEVDLVAPIRFTFSEPVQASTVTSSSLSVSIHGAPVAGTVACDSANSCTFTPAGPLPYREQVQVTLSTAVTDLAGRALASPYTSSFTTRGRAWSAEPLTVHTARPGLSPDVAMDGQGRTVAVWSQGVGSAFRPFASFYTPYVGWTAPVELDTVRAGNAEQPAVAMNAAGRAVAVWVLRNGAQADLYAAEYAPGGGWSTPRAVESRGEPVSTPRVAVDDAGNALAVWRQSDGTAESAWAARLSVGVGWSAPLLLETEPGAVTAPVLAAVPTGEALAAWTQPDAASTARVRTSRFAPDTGWTVAAQLPETAAQAPVAAALSLDGSAVVVFRGPLGAPNAVSAFAARYEPGTGWSAAVELGAALSSTEEPSVAMDPWGRALVAWTGPGSTSPQAIQVRRYNPGGGWVRLPLETSTSGQPVVAADGQGNFQLLWVENASGIDRVMQARYAEGSIALGTPRPLEPQHSGTSKRPRAVANTAGNTAAVWYRDNGTGFSGNLVYASLYQ